MSILRSVRASSWGLSESTCAVPVCQRARSPSRSFSRTRGLCSILRDESWIRSRTLPRSRTNCRRCVAHGSAARLPGLTSAGFKERISGRRHAQGKEHLYRRVEHVFLQRVNNLMFHHSSPPRRPCLSQDQSYPKQNPNHFRPLKLPSPQIDNRTASS